MANQKADSEYNVLQINVIMSIMIIIDISDKLIFCKGKSTGYNLKKNGTQDLVPSFSRTNGLKCSFFNCIVKEWNSLPNHRIYS